MRIKDVWIGGCSTLDIGNNRTNVLGISFICTPSFVCPFIIVFLKATREIPLSSGLEEGNSSLPVNTESLYRLTWLKMPSHGHQTLQLWPRVWLVKYVWQTVAICHCHDCCSSVLESKKYFAKKIFLRKPKQYNHKSLTDSIENIDRCLSFSWL